MDNNLEGGGNGREVQRAGGGAEVGGKGRQLYLNNNKIRGKKLKLKKSFGPGWCSSVD